MTSPDDRSSIAIVGGTGDLGSAIGRRLANAGYPVIIGSRSKARAETTAQAVSAANAKADIRGADNLAAADSADIVFLCVPFENQIRTLEEIAPVLPGKLLIDTTVPLVPPKVARVQLPPELSAAMRAQELLGETVEVVSALHNVAAAHLAEDGEIDCDVLVFGDKRASRAKTVELIEAMGLTGLHAGALANSTAAEALTSVLIFMNRHYNSPGAGIRITRLEAET